VRHNVIALGLRYVLANMFQLVRPRCDDSSTTDSTSRIEIDEAKLNDDDVGLGKRHWKCVFNPL